MSCLTCRSSPRRRRADRAEDALAGGGLEPRGHWDLRQRRHVSTRWPHIPSVYMGHQALVAGCGMICRTDRAGTFENREPSPSAIVGCARMASRSFGYGRAARIAVCSTSTTAPASVPVLLETGNGSAL